MDFPEILLRGETVETSRDDALKIPVKSAGLEPCPKIHVDLKHDGHESEHSEQ